MTSRVQLSVPSLRLIGLLGLILALAGALTTASAETSAVGVQSFADRVQFQAQSENVEQVQLEVFNLSGQVAYKSDWAQGQSLSWNLQTQTGRDVANGVYLYVLRTEDAQGITERHIGKLAVMDGKLRRASRAPERAPSSSSPEGANEGTVQAQAKNFGQPVVVNTNNKFGFELNMSGGGSGRFRIAHDAGSPNVGFNLVKKAGNNPKQVFAFAVFEDGSTNLFTIFNNTDGSLAMGIDGNNNMGIQTRNPSQALDVAGKARIRGLTNCDTIDTDADGKLSCGTDATGGNAWELDGNSGTSPGTDFLGTTDNTALQLHVDGNRALRVEPSSDNRTGFTPNLVGGHANNEVKDSSDSDAPIVGATISGGGQDTGGGCCPNTVGDDFATVGGGQGNSASGNSSTVSGGLGNTASGEDSTVSGGQGNDALGNDSTVGGGIGNTASGQAATIPGGGGNTASATVAYAAGNLAAAENNGAFVWNDSTEYHAIPNTTSDGLSSSTAVNGEPVTGSNTFSVSATGGVRFITGSASSPNVTYIPGDSAGWSTTSSRESKTNLRPVDPAQVLAGVAQLEMHTWEYQGEDGDGAGVRHLGPMAGAFHKVMPVELGRSDAHINSINLDGVALTAIQALYQRSEELQKTVQELKASKAELKQTVSDLKESNAEMEQQMESLMERVKELEQQAEND